MKVNQGKMGNKYQTIPLVIQIQKNQGPIYIAILYPSSLPSCHSHFIYLKIFSWSSIDCEFPMHSNANRQTPCCLFPIEVH